MSEENLNGWVAWHPDGAWRSVSIQSATDHEEFIWDTLQAILSSDDFNGCVGITEEMNIAEDLEEFEQAAIRAGWRRRPVKLVFLDEPTA